MENRRNCGSHGDKNVWHIVSYLLKCWSVHGSQKFKPKVYSTDWPNSSRNMLQHSKYLQLVHFGPDIFACCWNSKNISDFVGISGIDRSLRERCNCTESNGYFSLMQTCGKYILSQAWRVDRSHIHVCTHVGVCYSYKQVLENHYVTHMNIYYIFDEQWFDPPLGYHLNGLTI